MSKRIILSIKEVVDLVLRRNFQAIQDYFDQNSQLNGFKWLQFTLPAGTEKIKIKHGLGFAPRDIIISRLLASSGDKLTLHYAEFDADYIVASHTSTNSELKCRMYLGTSTDDVNTDILSPVTTQEF